MRHSIARTNLSPSYSIAHRRRARVAGLALALASGVAAASIGGAARAATPDTEVPFLLNTGVSIHPFIANVGQDGSDVLYSARGPAGTVLVRQGDMAIALAANGAEGRATLVAQLSGEELQDLVVNAAQLHGARANVYVGADPSQWSEDLDTWARLSAVQPYVGVDLDIDTTGRHLRWSFHAATPQRVAAIRWQYPGAAGVELTSRGELLVELPAYDFKGAAIPGASRTVRVEPPRAFQAGKNGAFVRRDVAFVLEGGEVSLVLDGAAPGKPVLVEVMTGYARFRPVNDSMYSGDAIWAESTGEPLLGGGRGGDIVVSRLDAQGKKIARVTVLGGAGGSAAGGLGRGDGGHVWLTGTTGAADFPILDAVKPALGGGTDAVLVELDGDGQIVRSSYWGGPGEDRGDDLEIDPAGNIWLAGVAGEDFPSSPSELSFGTRFVAGGVKSQTRFVSRIAPDDMVHAGTVTFPAVPGPSSDPGSGGCTFPPAPGGTPGSVTITADGKVWVGAETVVHDPATVTYQQASTHDGCQKNADGWGYEALCWKHNRSGVSYSPAAASSNGAGWLTSAVGDQDYLTLNDLEANPSVFPTDPGGTWEGPNNLARSAEEMALAAALYMHRWGSPVYANLTPAAVSSGFPVPVGIHEVTFSGTDPANICDFDGFTNNPGSPGFNIPIYDAAANCAFYYSLSISSIQASYWDRSGYVSSETLGGTSWWGSFQSASEEYVGDPPEEEAFMTAHVAEIAELQSHRVVRDVPVEKALYAEGEMVGTWVEEDTVYARR